MASLYLVYDECDRFPAMLCGGRYVAVHFKEPPPKESIPDEARRLAERHLDVLAGDD